jgi:hypothetical protein
MTFVKQIGGAAALGAAMVIGAGLCAPPAQAAYTLTLEQVGSNVVATGSGTLDLAGLTFLSSATGVSGMTPADGEITVGAVPTSLVIYRLVTGPMSFGGGGVTNASIGSGDNVGIDGLDENLRVPTGYVSGATLSSSATWDGQTLASLGVSPGVYVWTWEPLATATDDSFTLDAVAATVPEPASLALLALPLGLVMFVAAWRRGMAL